jgi:hypothetical protein
MINENFIFEKGSYCITQKCIESEGSKIEKFERIMEMYKGKSQQELLLYLLNVNLNILNELDFIKGQFRQFLSMRK